MVSANIPKDRLFLFLIFALVFAWQYWVKKDQAMVLEGKYLLFAGLMLAGFMAVLLKFKLGPIGNDSNGAFQVSNRYFMPLTALGIIGTTLFSIRLFRLPKSKWVRAGIFIGLAALLVFRIHKTAEFYPLNTLFPLQ